MPLTPEEITKIRVLHEKRYNFCYDILIPAICDSHEAQAARIAELEQQLDTASHNAQFYSAQTVELEQENARLATEMVRFRMRAFHSARVEGFCHSTSCLIWGDNGQGGTSEGFEEPLPCNCGCSANWAVKVLKDAEEKTAQLERENEQLKGQQSSVWEAEGLLASCTDLANSWARETYVQESPNETGLRGLIDRLWASASTRIYELTGQLAQRDKALAEAPHGRDCRGCSVEWCAECESSELGHLDGKCLNKRHSVWTPKPIAPCDCWKSRLAALDQKEPGV